MVEAMGRTWHMGWRQCQCVGAKSERMTPEPLPMEELARIAKVPRRYLGAFVSAGSDQRGVLRNSPQSILICGPRGCGKTHLACELLGELARCGNACLFAVSPDVFGNLGDAERDGTIARMRSVPFLVVDDLGKERPNAWALEAMFSVVNARYNSRLCTIATSQLELPDIGRHLASGGDRETALAIVSRLSEGANVVRLDGADRRIGGA